MTLLPRSLIQPISAIRCDGVTAPIGTFPNLDCLWVELSRNLSRGPRLPSFQTSSKPDSIGLLITCRIRATGYYALSRSSAKGATKEDVECQPVEKGSQRETRKGKRQRPEER